MRNAICNGRDFFLSDEIVEAFNLPSNRVSVDHLQELVDFQQPPERTESEDREAEEQGTYDECSYQITCAPKLTKASITQGHFEKMSISGCLRVLSYATVRDLPCVRVL